MLQRHKFWERITNLIYSGWKRMVGGPLPRKSVRVNCLTSLVYLSRRQWFCMGCRRRTGWKGSDGESGRAYLICIRFCTAYVFISQVVMTVLVCRPVFSSTIQTISLPSEQLPGITNNQHRYIGINITFNTFNTLVLKHAQHKYVLKP